LQADLGDAVTLLEDPGGRAVAGFGMTDPAPFPARPMARAGIFFIDRAGVVRHRWLTRHYRRRPDPARILRDIR